MWNDEGVQGGRLAKAKSQAGAEGGAPERVPGADGQSPPATLVRTTARHGFCPLCGRARPEIPASAVSRAEVALCPGRCSAAWHALAALRQRESVSEPVRARRRSEYEAGEPHPALLSELLLRRWREGDWTVTPEQLLMQVSEPDGKSCDSV
jgi:hypothetical protein